MATKKVYADAPTYEAKLKRVMERFGADNYSYDWTRTSAYVELSLKGQRYRFDHSVEKAAAHGFKLTYGTDVFAQIVLSLEDLARMAERGIYELQTYLAGMKFLPPPKFIPDCLEYLGFTDIPTVVDINARYRTLAKTAHPDGGGSDAEFTKLKKAAEAAVDYVQNR